MSEPKKGYANLYQPSVKSNGNGYSLALGSSAEGSVLCYRTGMAVYEEIFSKGTYGPCGWNAAGYPLNVLSNCNTRFDLDTFIEPSAFSFELDGVNAVCNMTLEGIEEEDRENVHEVRVRLACAAKPFGVTVVTRLDGTDAFERFLVLENRSGAPVSVSHLDVYNGGIEVQTNLLNESLYGHPAADELYELGYMDHDGGVHEGDFNWHKLKPDTTSFDGNWQRARWRYPMAALYNRIQGTTLLMQLAYSGGFRFTFDLDANAEKNNSTLSCKVSLAAIEPALVLAAGETYTSPSMHFSFVHGGLDEAVNAMNEHLRLSYLKTDNRTLLVGAGMGPEHDMSVETSKAFIDQMAEMGGEVFIIDAGWYCPPGEEATGWWNRNGDWHPDTQRYPNGIEEIREYAHSKGMKFGMWLESERLGEFSAIRKEHPEFFTTHINGDSSNGFVNMADPKVAAFIEEEVARVISEYKLDLFRVDYNVGSRELLTLNHKNGRECNAPRHVQAVYNMYLNLKKRFPDVIFENCAGGGGRCDLGICQAFNHTWVSDNQRAPRSVAITNGMTMVLPPERVDRLVAGMGCHAFGELALQMRNAMFGHMSLNVLDPRDARWNPQQMGFIQHSVQLYKDFIRPMLPDCSVYHHTPNTIDFTQGKPIVLQLVSRERNRSTLGIFSTSGVGRTETVVYPKGLDLGKTYTVTFDNSGDSFTETGASLTRKGLRVVLESALSSELILFESN